MILKSIKSCRSKSSLIRITTISLKRILDTRKAMMNLIPMTLCEMSPFLISAALIRRVKESRTISSMTCSMSSRQRIGWHIYRIRSQMKNKRICMTHRAMYAVHLLEHLFMLHLRCSAVASVVIILICGHSVLLCSNFLTEKFLGKVTRNSSSFSKSLTGKLNIQIACLLRSLI